MKPQSVIREKREGGALSREQLEAFVAGAVSGDWTSGQVGAMLMACYLKGLSHGETSLLLETMLHSGELLDMDGLDRPVADKHSTGGVGDKISLILAPLAASCGLAVPMLSGRGLGHTGGTLDKLESIPGFRVVLTPAEVRSQVERIGCAIAGQSETIAPADRILYAMRDETCTVENPALVAASILSKKLAEGLDSLLLDVKTGRGAFFQDPGASESLARLMVDLGKAAGCHTGAWVTDMNSPLGRAVGNALEVAESIQVLRGEGPVEVASFTCELVAGMLVLSGVRDSFEDAAELCRTKLESGEAVARFAAMVEAQGGDPAVVEDATSLPVSKCVTEIQYEQADTVWVSGVDARAIAEIVLETGAGRRNAGDRVDPAAGISALVCVGDRLEPGQLLGRLHASGSGGMEAWADRLRNAVSLSGDPVEPPERILKRIL